LAGVDSTIIVQFFGTQLNEAGSVQTAQAAIALPTPTKKPVLSPTAIPEQATVDSPTSTENLEEQKLATAPATAVQKEDRGTLYSPFNITRTMSLITIIVLGSVMVVDAIIVSRKKIRRLSGRNFAHLAFLGVILSIVLLIGAGRIL